MNNIDNKVRRAVNKFLSTNPGYMKKSSAVTYNYMQKKVAGGTNIDFKTFDTMFNRKRTAWRKTISKGA